jgi:DNA mismatch repair ATPase MutS
MLRRSLYAICLAWFFQGYLAADMAAVASANVPNEGIQNAVEDYTSGEFVIKKIITLSVSKVHEGLFTAKILPSLVDDLNIAAIAQTFDCKSSIGTWYLQEMLTHPLTAQSRDAVLAERRKIIEFLVNNPEQKEELESLLNLVHEHEQGLIKLMSEYFKGKTCPELASLEAMKKAQQPGYAVAEFLNVNPAGKFLNTALLGLSAAYCTYMTYVIASEPLIPIGPKVGFTALFSGLAAFDTYMWYSTEYKLAFEKRAKMHELNRLIDISEKIEALCKANSLQVRFKISEIQDAKALEVIGKLKNARYKEKNTFVFTTQLVHGLLYKIYENEESLAPIMVSIAEMDAYNAIATKIIESKDKDNKFCFATFIETEQLHTPIRAKGFWNVLVKNPVVNNIDEDKNVILTGPNAGGKTTSIRSILQNILLAQTFGVAAAESFECTMFDVIESYLHVSDDLIKGDSLFIAEVKRAQAILEKIKTLEEGKKYFFALDELFTGTVAEDGEECAYQFVNRISEFTGIQFIYATHFKRLKEVGNNNPRCANYKVGAPARNAAGTLVYPFTFMQGANEVNIAKEIAKDAGLFA